MAKLESFRWQNLRKSDGTPKDEATIAVEKAIRELYRPTKPTRRKKKKSTPTTHPTEKVSVTELKGSWRYQGESHRTAKHLVKHIKRIILQDKKFTFHKYTVDSRVTTVIFLDNLENILVHIIVPINSDEHYIKSEEYLEVPKSSEFVEQPKKPEKPKEKPNSEAKKKKNEKRRAVFGEKMRHRIAKITRITNKD